MNEVKFVYQRNKEDVMAHTIWHRMVRSKFNKAVNVIFPVFGIFALVASIGAISNPLQYIAIAYLVFYPLISYWMIKTRINQMFKNPAMAFDITTYTVNHAGVLTESDKGSFLLEWDRIFKIYETKKYFFLYVDKRSNLLFNKEFLGEKQDAVRELIKKYAPPFVHKIK